jgi:hypothetical protein
LLARRVRLVWRIRGWSGESAGSGRGRLVWRVRGWSGESAAGLASPRLFWRVRGCSGESAAGLASPRPGRGRSEKTPTCGGSFRPNRADAGRKFGPKIRRLVGGFWPSSLGLAESVWSGRVRWSGESAAGLAASARSGRVRSVWPKSTFAGWRQMNCRPG